MKKIKEKITQLKEELDVLLVAHFYQKDDVVSIADLKGDSLELAKNASKSERGTIVFCGVSFMGQSVKILAPNKRVVMPKMACCSMARMISSEYFDTSIKKLREMGISEIMPVTYINSSYEVKAKVGQMGGYVCTSSNAKVIMQKALSEGKKIFFLPDKCLGLNLANDMGLKATVLNVDSKEDILESSIICYDGFCSVHQLFTPEDVDFYRQKYEDILVAVHPECSPEVVQKADFVGSTSQIIKYVQSLPLEQKVVVGTEFNLVNRLRPTLNGVQTTFVLSSTKPECPTMNETSLEDVLNCLQSIQAGRPQMEVLVQEDLALDAKKALEKMFAIS